MAGILKHAVLVSVEYDGDFNTKKTVAKIVDGEKIKDYKYYTLKNGCVVKLNYYAYYMEKIL